MSTNPQQHGQNGNGARGPLPQALLPLQWQDAFLEEFRKSFSLAKAALVAGVSRPTVYKYLRQDADFKQRYDDAKADAIDDLQESSFERAKNGTKQIRTFYDKQGNVASESITIQHETALTIKYHEAYLPEFRPPTRIEHTGANGGPIELEHTMKAQLTLAVQNGINSGMSLPETLKYLTLRGVEPEHLSLVDGKDLHFPEQQEAIDITLDHSSERSE